jgi:uncharacterized protein YneF (UPF0154 family)
MNTQKGFFKILVIIVCLLVIGGGVYFYIQKQLQEIVTEEVILNEEPISTVVSFGPYYFSSEKLIELSEEDLKEQAEILTEISNDDLSNLDKLKIINPEVSKQLKKVDGGLYLESLTSAEGLILPETIGEDLWLYSLPESEKQKLREQRPDLADKI